eukprot:CAMPEP_0119425254 /NCGR_PEP_ID=MMETSP1335-20130426/34188_1 /TAXON_ID=259385 /ORGANISM="Chrysoculter rhomboideus, Strain RCC1486" /LENGTH=297 /DNA_ID=CAMNT_0007450813 /DNA_START=95 /DNA_END=987 /DNA_ORIENTATION=+
MNAKRRRISSERRHGRTDCAFSTEVSVQQSRCTVLSVPRTPSPDNAEIPTMAEPPQNCRRPSTRLTNNKPREDAERAALNAEGRRGHVQQYITDDEGRLEGSGGPVHLIARGCALMAVSSSVPSRLERRAPQPMLRRDPSPHMQSMAPPPQLGKRGSGTSAPCPFHVEGGKRPLRRRKSSQLHQCRRTERKYAALLALGSCRLSPLGSPTPVAVHAVRGVPGPPRSAGALARCGGVSSSADAIIRIPLSDDAVLGQCGLTVAVQATAVASTRDSIVRPGRGPLQAVEEMSGRSWRVE